ncbi:MAG: proline racemase [Saprospiraceae bacterium]|nr:proline racemase [Saprospiraceae bacterium]
MNRTYQNILKKTSFTPHDGSIKIKTIDMHTGGEPLRVILEGFPKLDRHSVLDNRRLCKEKYDHLRKALMFEPRGHNDMYGCILVPPNDAEGDFGIIFLHNEGYSTMCGHAIVAISTLAVEMNWIEVSEGDNLIKIDAPCGRIQSFVNVADGKVVGVRFHCVPSFVVSLDNQINVDGLGNITFDLAYGGAYYAYVDMAKNSFDFDLGVNSYSELIKQGMAIKNAVVKSNIEIEHPFEDDLSFLYGTIFIDNDPSSEQIDSRNVCIFAEGEVDRCPTGSGVSGRMAIHKKRNELEIGEKMIIESITGSRFTGSVVSEVEYGPYIAVIPEVEGNAFVTGQHAFIINPNDPFKEGFFLK